ncbi:anhydro-N-acetylmuramic acid kinase-like [Ylistrum balloti]|uniref:anhydro-N-acetylmuramic acid kinase-like n=1 Tax=Ylistrum balloti TaxID=509963 RepID=UPI002905C67C|nr:anhydro-N-acetylmuramic acid kinase-like [Ylistrum balloti]
MTSFTGLGCMSGSSLDGLDLCHVEFTGDIETDIWGYHILEATTIPYDQELIERLRNSAKLSGEELIQLHVEYGHYIGTTIKEFLSNKHVDFVASHGHTVFHQPHLRYTFQLGDGETTASYLNSPFVCNFRNKDVALGGQGAPLVPNGEKFLFSANDICINLGGIANIGLKGQRGYDICPCNSVLNKLAGALDPSLQQDTDGNIAAKGDVIPEVLDRLESLAFYSKEPPKSLGAKWIEDHIDPILDVQQYSIPNLMRTFVEHVALRLKDACVLNSCQLSSDVVPVLVTGGGAFNKYLMDLFKEKLRGTKIEVEKVDDETICFKEALIFAFLGLRCILGEENVFSCVTGSRCDSVSGSIHRPLSSDGVPAKFKQCYFEFKRSSSHNMNM